MDSYRDDNAIEDPFIDSLFMFAGAYALPRAELQRRYRRFRRRLPPGELQPGAVYRVIDVHPTTGGLRYVLEHRSAPCGA